MRKALSSGRTKLALAIAVIVALGALIPFATSASSMTESAIVLDPSADLTVTVNTAQPLIATVTDEHGDGIGGVVVTFEVFSGDLGYLNLGTVTTDSDGNASVSYTRNSAGVDNPEASFLDDGGYPHITQHPNITWAAAQEPVPSNIVLDPADFVSNTVGDVRVLTATVTDTGGSPVEFVDVTFVIDAIINGNFVTLELGPFATDGNGEATTSYSRSFVVNDVVGAQYFDGICCFNTSNHVIIDWVTAQGSDANSDGVLDADDACDSTPSGAVVNSAGCGFIKITGGGHVPTGSKDHSHSFGFYIQLGDGGWMVNFEYNDNHKGKPKDKKNALAPLQYHANELATFAEVFIDP